MTTWRRSMRGLTLLLLAAAITVPAAPMRAAEPDADAAESDLIDTFTDLCLNRFPDAAAFAAGAASRRLTPMNADIVKQFLHDDPGRGWFGASPSGSYVVTLESPPYLACAVRRRQQPSSVLRTTFQLAVGLWAANQKIGPLRPMRPMHQARPDMTIDMTAQAVTGPDGKPTQVFMVLVTDYPSGRSEVRFVRQFPP